MKKGYLKVILIIAISILCLIVNMPKTFATISPTDITGDVGGGELKIESMDKLINMLQIVGTFLAAGVLMVLGIKYMAGSVEERAEYKKSMMPYLIGCFLLFGASSIAPKIMELFENIDDTESMGNRILGLLQIVGSFVAVGALMIIGIKYMLGSTEERASYKKSMLPYVIGAVLLFAAVNLASVIYDIVTQSIAVGSTSYQEQLTVSDNEQFM